MGSLFPTRRRTRARLARWWHTLSLTLRYMTIDHCMVDVRYRYAHHKTLKLYCSCGRLFGEKRKALK